METQAPSVKARIDAAAIELFVHMGVDAATTKLIAKAAGVSEGAIYRHYASKDELALTLFMGAHRRLSGLVEAAAAGEHDLRAKADAIVRAYCQAADENWPLFTFHMLSMHRFLRYYQEDGRTRSRWSSGSSSAPCWTPSCRRPTRASWPRWPSG